jgi:hypothetical protein
MGTIVTILSLGFEVNRNLTGIAKPLASAIPDFS